jgi:Bacterial Ig-like domain (group 3)
MPIFTVSLLSNVTVSALVQVTADNQADAVIAAEKLHNQGALTWTFNGAPIPVFSGPLTSIWASPGVTPPQGPKLVPVTLGVTPTVLVFGAEITINATIAPGATGLVTFFSGEILIGTATPNLFGVATLTITPPIGVQTVTSSFAGDIYFAPNTSNSVQITVKAPPTTTAIRATPNPQTVGSAVIITATVSGTGSPDGLVIFSDGVAQIGANVLVGGTCSISIETLAIGSHSLTAMYQGSNFFAPSTSPAVTEVINP